jgi:hypothetical protein
MKPTRCQVTKKNGKQCKNKAKEHGACGIEAHKISRRKELGLELPTQNGYVPLFIDALDATTRNPAYVCNDIATRLREGPSELDKPGHIYMYCIRNDVSAMYRKIGRTERLPERRVAEWPNSKLCRSWECKRNRMAEYLIHKYLDYARMERLKMPQNNEYLSVWRARKEFVADATYAAHLQRLGDDEEHQITVAYRRAIKIDIEWFKEKEETLIRIITAVCRAIDHHFN